MTIKQCFSQALIENWKYVALSNGNMCQGTNSEEFMDYKREQELWCNLKCTKDHDLMCGSKTHPNLYTIYCRGCDEKKYPLIYRSGET